jgi:SAM-dependent methyltransferase
MDRLEPVGVNAPQIDYWNGPAGDRWARLADSQDVMLEALGLAAMDACDIQSGHTVLDAGCGSGTTTFEIANRVGVDGHVIGIDLSGPMLEVGRERLKTRGIDTIEFDNKDIATYPFEKEMFDRVFSRFGVMFFIDPIAAFTNIRSGLKSGGRLAFVCWQALNKNPWMEIPFKVALQHVPTPAPADPEAPGPMAFADPERVRRILSAAGFDKIGLDALEMDLPLEADARSTAQKLVQSSGAVSRLLSNETDDIKTRVEDDLCKAVAEYQTDNGVRLGSATWIVSATSS